MYIDHTKVQGQLVSTSSITWSFYKHYLEQPAWFQKLWTFLSIVAAPFVFISSIDFKAYWLRHRMGSNNRHFKVVDFIYSPEVWNN